jgi:anti-sigma factor RsiW
MRCSSCEPLLDAYLEGSLGHMHSRRISAHLRDCAACAALFSELRVVDALLTTARAPGVAVDFTAAIVSATKAAPPASPRRRPLGLALVLYLGVAWTFVLLLALRSHEVAGFVWASVASGARDLAAVGAAVHALAPVTPVAAATVTCVLLVDAVLLAALFYGYRRIRPILSLYLSREERT